MPAANRPCGSHRKAPLSSSSSAERGTHHRGQSKTAPPTVTLEVTDTILPRTGLIGTAFASAEWATRLMISLIPQRPLRSLRPTRVGGRGRMGPCHLYLHDDGCNSCVPSGAHEAPARVSTDRLAADAPAERNGRLPGGVTDAPMGDHLTLGGLGRSHAIVQPNVDRDLPTSVQSFTLSAPPLAPTSGVVATPWRNRRTLTFHGRHGERRGVEPPSRDPCLTPCSSL